MRFAKYIGLVTFLLITAELVSVKKTCAQGFYFYNSDYYESQTVVEFGFFGGIVNCMTDLGGSKNGKANSGFGSDFTLKKTNFTAGAYLAATYKDFLAGRIEFGFGKVESADSNLKGATDKWALGRYDRNLSFKSSIMHLAAIVELHPRFITDYVDRDPPRFSPYLLGGIGFTFFNPKANLNGTWYELEPLRLEGQGFTEYPDRKPYKKSSLSYPLGIGFRYEASQLFTLRLELTRHLLSTDYLDDVSQGDWVDLQKYPDIFYRYLSIQQATAAVQLYNRSTAASGLNPPRNTRPRGNPDDNDAFWNVVFKVGITLNREKRDLVNNPFH